MRLGREQSRGVVEEGVPEVTGQAEDAGARDSRDARRDRPPDREPARVAGQPPRISDEEREEEALLRTR